MKLPEARYLHVYIARGNATLEGAGSLQEADAIRITGVSTIHLTAGSQGAEVLLWETL